MKENAASDLILLLKRKRGNLKKHEIRFWSFLKIYWSTWIYEIIKLNSKVNFYSIQGSLSHPFRDQSAGGQ